jgi:peptide/nickel transport system permease protein
VSRPGRPALSITGLVGLTLLAIILASALAAPILAPHDPLAQNTRERLLPPIWEGGKASNLLGTDSLGRDVLSRLLYGGRVSLLVGFLTVAISGSAGLLVGLVSGYVGGWIDRIIQMVAYAQLSMPVILLAIAVIAVFGSGLINVILVLAIASWVPSSRLVRGLVFQTKQLQFVEAARMVGATHTRIVRRHIFPQVVSVFLALAALQVGSMIIFEAALSFLGLGVQPPTPTWGGMISDARDYMHLAPWLSVFPGIAIALTVLAVNAVARWLRDVLDPRSRSALRSTRGTVV